MSAYVIDYDICDPQRLQRVYREMCRHATPLEYSVFLLVGGECAKARCLAAMAGMIEPDEDDVRCYPLPTRGYQSRIGRATLPAGIVWTGLPANIS
jgi:CRISPR-associated protein Cas2